MKYRYGFGWFCLNLFSFRYTTALCFQSYFLVNTPSCNKCFKQSYSIDAVLTLSQSKLMGMGMLKIWTYMTVYRCFNSLHIYIYIMILNAPRVWSSIAQSVCQQALSLLKIGFQRPSGFESCIQQRQTTCLLSIRKSLACARASKLTTTNMYRQSQVRMPNGSEVRWAECLLIESIKTTSMGRC